MRDIILAFDRFGDQALLLGRVDENRATRVLIDLKSILSQYPDAIASITVKPPGRVEYPATVKQEGGILTWEITRADIGNKAGSGQAQITIQDANGTVIKTAIACTRVGESLGDAAAPAPDPVEKWIDKATGTLADVERAGNAAQAVADEVQRRLDDGDFVGPQGPKGDRGETGPIGPQGPKGEKGDKGDTGEKGDTGPQGETGAKGDAFTFDDFTLEQLESLRGPKGDTGATGAQGAKGDKGDKGDTGAKGEPGKDAVIDATLTQEGEAADAAATGKRLAEIEKAVAEKADKARQNILIGTETGNPVSVSDAFSAPLCGLTVYGKSTQDGTPTPDAPVPIVSAGDGGSVAVKVTGKNLFPVVTQTNLSIIIKPDGGIRYGYTFYIPAGSTIVITCNASIDTNCYVGDFDTKTQKYTPKSVIASETGETKSAVVQSGWHVVYIATDYKPHIIEKLNKAKIQMEIGTKSTAYSPYREQLFALPTPNGLPGIPVTSGGNYTDPAGQQWICDEVDFGKSVKVQRIDKGAFDATKTLAEQNATLATPIETPLTSDELAAYKALTTYAPNTVVQAADGAGLKLDYQRDVNIVIKNLEDAIASMTTT